MFYIQVADLLVQIENEHEEVKERCRDYIVEPAREPDFVVQPDQAHMNRVLQYIEENELGHLFPDVRARAESLATPPAFYNQLAGHGALQLHAVLIDLDGNGLAFTAPSGYGKTTQSHLWQQCFGNRMRVINGDSPVIRRKNGVFHAYGTPFCGSEQWVNINTSVPLKAICHLEHSDVTSVQRLSPAMAVGQLLRGSNWLISRANPDHREAMIALWEELASEIPVYKLCCTLEPDSPLAAWESIRKGL